MFRYKLLGVMVTCLLIVGLGFLPTDPAQAFGRKPIILDRIDSIDSFAQIGHGGRTVQLTMGGPAVRVVGNTRIDALILIYQEETGAIGFGVWGSSRLPEDTPETVTFPVVAHALGSTRFEAGSATACYFAEERVGGKIVREWSRCETVELFEDP